MILVCVKIWDPKNGSVPFYFPLKPSKRGYLQKHTHFEGSRTPHCSARWHCLHLGLPGLQWLHGALLQWLRGPRLVRVWDVRFQGQLPAILSPSGALFSSFWGRAPLETQPNKKGCPFSPIATGHLSSTDPSFQKTINHGETDSPLERYAKATAFGVQSPRHSKRTRDRIPRFPQQNSQGPKSSRCRYMLRPWGKKPLHLLDPEHRVKTGMIGQIGRDSQQKYTNSPFERQASFSVRYPRRPCKSVESNTRVTQKQGGLGLHGSLGSQPSGIPFFFLFSWERLPL